MTGIDNIGHTLGFNHSYAHTKLDEYNTFIERIYHRMDENSVLLVLSDHGQTNFGNHGGDTEEETTSYIFAAVKGTNSFRTNFTDLILSSDL